MIDSWVCGHVDFCGLLVTVFFCYKVGCFGASFLGCCFVWGLWRGCAFEILGSWFRWVYYVGFATVAFRFAGFWRVDII